MSDTLATMLVVALGLSVAGLLGLCAYLVVRDTRRKKGNWGINLEPSVCRKCDTPCPPVRTPANFRQMLWGGWTCPHCGYELDKWGEPIDNQPPRRVGRESR